jgi:hypothetical protein
MGIRQQSIGEEQQAAVTYWNGLNIEYIGIFID